jgi:hypothetical protein
VAVGQTQTDELVVAAAAWRGGWVVGPWTRDLVKRALADQQVF